MSPVYYYGYYLAQFLGKTNSSVVIDGDAPTSIETFKAKTLHVLYSFSLTSSPPLQSSESSRVKLKEKQWRRVFDHLLCVHHLLPIQINRRGSMHSHKRMGTEISNEDGTHNSLYFIEIDSQSADQSSSLSTREKLSPIKFSLYFFRCKCMYGDRIRRKNERMGDAKLVILR